MAQRYRWLIFFNNTSEVPRSGWIPRAVVVQLWQLGDKLDPFLPDIPHCVSILKQICEWIKIPMVALSSTDLFQNRYIMRNIWKKWL